MQYSNDFVTTFADTYYLDMFANECYANETERQLYGAPKKSHSPDSSDSLHLYNFLTQHNIDSFDVFTQSVCLLNGNTNHEASNNLKKTLSLFLVLSGIFVFIAIILRLLFPIHENSSSPFGAIFIGIMGIAAFTFFIGSEILTRLRCTQKTDGVCVALHKSLSFNDNSSYYVYRPVYYVKYNDIGYLLMENEYSNIGTPRIGDITHALYINPTNPLDHVRKKSIRNYLLVLFGFGLCMFFSIMMLVS